MTKRELLSSETDTCEVEVTLSAPDTCWLQTVIVNVMAVLYVDSSLYKFVYILLSDPSLPL